MAGGAASPRSSPAKRNEIFVFGRGATRAADRVWSIRGEE
jgi:hypothetical protein